MPPPVLAAAALGRQAGSCDVSGWGHLKSAVVAVYQLACGLLCPALTPACSSYAASQPHGAAASPLQHEPRGAKQLPRPLTRKSPETLRAGLQWEDDHPGMRPVRPRPSLPPREDAGPSSLEEMRRRTSLGPVGALHAELCCSCGAVRGLDTVACKRECHQGKWDGAGLQCRLLQCILTCCKTRVGFHLSPGQLAASSERCDTAMLT